MEIKQPGWERDLTDFVQDDIDGRFWLDDMVRKVIDGQIPSKYFDEYAEQRDEDVSEESFNAGHEAGYMEGYDDGRDSEEYFIDGYDEGYRDGQNGIKHRHRTGT